MSRSSLLPSSSAASLPAGHSFRGLLYYYRLELVHLVPNSVTVVSTFIHFCEAYLGNRRTFYCGDTFSVL
jgi:hypothetical protein